MNRFSIPLNQFTEEEQVILTYIEKLSPVLYNEIKRLYNSRAVLREKKNQKRIEFLEKADKKRRSKEAIRIQFAPFMISQALTKGIPLREPKIKKGSRKEPDKLLYDVQEKFEPTEEFNEFISQYQLNESNKLVELVLSETVQYIPERIYLQRIDSDNTKMLVKMFVDWGYLTEDKMPLFIDKDRKEIAFCLIRLIDDENRTLGIFPLYHRSYYIIDEERSADSLFIGMIKNLSPNKKYKYRIECYKKTCGTLFASTFLQEFKTSFDLKEANDTLFFSIISDLHAGRKSGFLRGKLQKKVVSGNKDLEKVFSNIALTEKQTTFNRGYNLSIATGDLTENSSYTEYWADLFKRASRLWNHVPVFTTLGNHDYYTGGTGKGNVLGGSDEDCRYWHRYITNPVSSAGCLPGHWYSLDQGNVHLVFLDSNGMGWGKYSLDCQSEQWLWLENDLKNWRDKIDRGEKVPQFCIVFFHSAIVSCGYWGRGFNWGNDEKAQSYLTPLFRKYGVHLVSFGHDHLYQRSEWLGTTYLANGRSGGMLRPDFFWLRRRVIFNIKRSCGDSKTRVFTTIYVPPNTNYRSQQDLEKHENFKKQIRKELLTIPTAKFFVFGTRTLTNRIGRRIDKNKQIKEKIIDDFIMKKLDDHIWLRAYAVDKYKPIEKEELFDSGFIPVKINTLNENYQITCPEKVI